MKEYTIIERDENCLELSFSFDKTYTIIGSVFSSVLILLIFIKVSITNFSEAFILTGGIIALFNISLGSFFEWKKNKLKKLLIVGEDLIINDLFYCKVWNIKSVNISYNIDPIESGWTVYLKRHMNSSEYQIKRRLKQKDAHVIAEKISQFLDKPIVIDN